MKNMFSNGLIGLMTMFVFTACSNNEEVQPGHPSYRDGTFRGDRLTVTLDGEPLTSVSSVTIKSTLLNSNVDENREPGMVGSSNPTYNSTVTVTGFPTAGKITTFDTVSTLMGFDGEVTVSGVTYTYTGEFDDNPLQLHDLQTLTLAFTTR